MGTTPNYEFNVPVGSDIVNLLTQNNPNWSNLDTILKTISNTGVGTATELKTGTVHSLTRSDTDRKVFTFVATTNFVAGETFLLDGDQVTALTASGEQLSTGCYVIGSNVLVSVHDTLLTFYVPESTAKDAQKLGGELPSHYATEADLEEIQTDMSAVEAKLGTGVFQTQAQNAVDAVNELNTHLSSKVDSNNIYVRQIALSSTGTYYTVDLPSGWAIEDCVIVGAQYRNANNGLWYNVNITDVAIAFQTVSGTNKVGALTTSSIIDKVKVAVYKYR